MQKTIRGLEEQCQELESNRSAMRNITLRLLDTTGTGGDAPAPLSHMANSLMQPGGYDLGAPAPQGGGQYDHYQQQAVGYQGQGQGHFPQQQQQQFQQPMMSPIYNQQGHFPQQQLQLQQQQQQQQQQGPYRRAKKGDGEGGGGVGPGLISGMAALRSSNSMGDHSSIHSHHSHFSNGAGPGAGLDAGAESDATSDYDSISDDGDSYYSGSDSQVQCTHLLLVVHTPLQHTPRNVHLENRPHLSL